MIRLSLVCVTIIVIALFLHHPVTKALSLSHTASYVSFWVLLFFFGAFWVSIITNSFPMLWQMASFGTIGVYTGLYYTFSQAAAITAPWLTGALIDIVGYPGIFVFAALCMGVAMAVMSLVRKGEPHDDPKGLEASVA